MGRMAGNISGTNEANIATGLTKLFGGGENKMTAVVDGVGLVTLMIYIARINLPNYAAMITHGNPGLAFGIVLLIAGLSSYVGIRKVLKVDPFDIYIQGLTESAPLLSHEFAGKTGFCLGLHPMARGEIWDHTDGLPDALLCKPRSSAPIGIGTHAQYIQ